MVWLIISYIVSLILWSTGVITISGWWFIVGPFLFIPALIVMSMLFTAGAFVSAFSFFGLAVLGEKILDKIDEKMVKRHQIKLKKNGKV
jgi:hypothetical protein